MALNLPTDPLVSAKLEKSLASCQHLPKKMSIHGRIVNRYNVVLILCMSFFAWLLVKNAWYGDDAFITMRVIDNFVNGYGLVWNVGERVQVFTHPLWLFLMTPIYAVLKDPYQTIYGLSYSVSLATIFLFLSNFTKKYQTTIIAGLLIAASMAFIDYSSSGLENPLTHLLLIAMMIVVLKQPVSLKIIFFTSLIASLSAVNRLDTILFFIPVLGYQLFEMRTSRLKALSFVGIGFIPLIAWEIFALVYYGFPLPNTYYAKIAAEYLPAGWLQNQAWEYFKNSFLWDPITLGTIALSMVVVIWEQNLKKISILLGMACYLIYIISIGGDFMSGRFFSALFLIAATLLMTVDYGSLIAKVHFNTQILIAGAIIFVGLIGAYPPVFTSIPEGIQRIPPNGIANEKLYYFKDTSWVSRNQINTIHRWGINGLNLKDSGRRYTDVDSVGLFGYYAGPSVTILDNLAIADPLRARLPITGPIRIGHFYRVLPSGYADTLSDNYNNHLVNPDLRLYYDKLSILIHGDIFAPDRFQEIINFNLGRYEYLIQRYNDAPYPK